ncbi:MAG: hypothetical protein RR712_01920 [Terrisporobacter sp.]|uniref:hypothetical protein n=1 Tax=Terrisporobacter sp. TaxID=1965305 RepID=UPI002FC9FFFA
MDEKNNYLLDRLDFLEFKQSVLFLKPPQHRTQLFYDLSLEDFMKIKKYTAYYCTKINDDENVSLNDFSKGLIEIWAPAKSYPLSASLVAQSLMEEALYNKLLAH